MIILYAELTHLYSFFRRSPAHGARSLPPKKILYFQIVNNTQKNVENCFFMHLSGIILYDGIFLF